MIKRLGVKTRMWALVLGVASASAPAPSPAAEINQTHLTGEAIEGFDPVAYWLDGEPRRGRGIYGYEWRGATWRFASAEHRDLFKADPEKYAPQFGGYCAFAMGRGLKADIHPYFWRIDQGRLYLFVSPQARARWDEAPAKLEAAGEHAWAALNSNGS